MKKQSRKLNLNRETLIPLTTDALDAINGGASAASLTLTTTLTTTTGTSSISLCMPPTTTMPRTRACP